MIAEKDPRPSGPAPGWQGPAPEFEDEEPGSYLAELGARAGTVAWGLVNLSAILATGIALAANALDPGSGGYTPAKLVWALAPVSAALHLIVTLWQSALRRAAGSPAAFARPPPRRMLAASLLLALASLAAWIALRYVVGVA